jgi:hypothetical protein
MPILGDKLPLSAVFRCAVALLMSLMAASAAQATPIEFADFQLLNADQPVSFTETSGLFAASVPVIFNFTSQSGLSTVDHAGLLTITESFALTPASSLGGGFLEQSILPSTLSITEVGTGLNLLTMSFTGNLVGLSGGPNASLSGAEGTGQTVTFTSSFATFAGTENSYNLGLAEISPLLSTIDGFLNNFAANMDGQFTTDSASFMPIVPEPSSAVLFGMGLLAVAALACRKAAGAAHARKGLC